MIAAAPSSLLLPTLLQLLLLTVFIECDGTVAHRSRGCETIEVPMCKGLIDYNATILPNRFGHKTQIEVYWAMQPWWPFIDAGCSNNLRTFMCGLYLPRCSGDRSSPPQYPCSETCRKAKVRCSKQMRREGMRWSPRFKCSGLLPKSSRRCIAPQRERKKNRNKQYVLSDYSKLSMCRGIPFTQGSLPNMFLQSDLAEIEREMQQFKFLVDSGCSKKLRLFMCGAYMPFCVPGVVSEYEGGSSNNEIRARRDNFLVARGQPDVPFVVPCRELCQEVYDQCSGEYQQRTNGLPWPGKFHCHRYPSYIDRYGSNDDHNKSSTNITNSRRYNRRRGPTVSCTMPPYNYDGN